MFYLIRFPLLSTFFFFNDTATTEIYTLSLHDALPISDDGDGCFEAGDFQTAVHRHRRIGRGHHLFNRQRREPGQRDRKSTRLNSSHQIISYAVFCLKKKKKKSSTTKILTYKRDVLFEL